MYIGPFYFDSKEIFLIIATLLLGVAIAFGWDIWWFDRQVLLTVVLMILITKGLLPSIHNEAFFLLALATIFLTLYLAVFQVILFYLLTFLFFRVLRVM